MSSEPPVADKHANFWRACRYLGPYRGLVAVSIGCALLVGIILTGGLGAMIPIFRVLLDDQTIAHWVDRQLVEHRLGVRFNEEADGLLINKVKEDSPAADAGLMPGDRIALPAEQAPGEVLDQLTAASGDVALVTAQGARTIRLDPAAWYVRLADRVSSWFPTQPVKAIAAVFGVIFFLTILGSTIRFFQEHLSDRAAFYAVNDIRTRLYDRVLHIPMSFFGLKGTSDVTSRLVTDTHSLQEGFKTVLGQSIQEPIKVLFALSLSLYISWQLTLFIVLFAPLMAVLIRKFGKKMRRASRKAMQESSAMLGQVEGTLIGIRVVKASNAERFERRRYRNIMKGLLRQQVKMSRIDAISSPTLETLTLIVAGVVVIFAAYLVKVKGVLSPSEFFAVMACLMVMGEALRKLSKVNNHLQRANSAAARIFEILDMPVEKPRALTSAPSQGEGRGEDKRLRSTIAQNAPRKLPLLQREIRFEQITFSYSGSSAAAVQDVSLTVPKGQSVAVVGRNGSGKTTLLAMLPRFYDPTRGRITIDGIDTRTVSLASLRRQISIVTQDPIIFPGTIAQNIAYGHPLALRSELPPAVRDGLRERVIDAAKRAFAHEFILEKPNGYDTMLGEHGGQLSGGQKQRINIARAILRQTPILILDEATSQVDAESEHLIQQAIESLMHERTTFVIAHRFSTILSADTIVVMDRGRIVGQGRHEELLRECETYQQLYERQLFTAPAAATA